MKLKLFLIVTLVMMSVLSLGTGTFAQDDGGLPALDELGMGWTEILPEGNVCSDGSPYNFYVHPGATDNVLIHFKGGGACWDGFSCDLANPALQNPLYDPFLDPGDHPETRAGIFDLENPENPFADYTMVFVNYCTGDVHMGDNVATYTTTEGVEFEINHTGYDNATTVLNWVYENVPAPENVVLTGCSAGSLGSAFHAPFVMEQYPDAFVAQIGDAAGGYRGDLSVQMSTWHTADLLPDWIEGFEGYSAENLNFEALYMVGGAAYPDDQFGQINSGGGDPVQTGFLALVAGDTITLDEALTANLDDIENSIDNFAYYTAGGSLHCIIRDNGLYTYETDGARLLDWLNAVVAGENPDDVTCMDCAEPGMYEGMDDMDDMSGDSMDESAEGE